LPGWFVRYGYGFAPSSRNSLQLKRFEHFHEMIFTFVASSILTQRDAALTPSDSGHSNGADPLATRLITVR
jgi:hypothetical protein